MPRFHFSTTPKTFGIKNRFFSSNIKPEYSSFHKLPTHKVWELKGKHFITEAKYTLEICKTQFPEFYTRCSALERQQVQPKHDKIIAILDKMSLNDPIEKTKANITSLMSLQGLAHFVDNDLLSYHASYITFINDLGTAKEEQAFKQEAGKLALIHEECSDNDAQTESMVRSYDESLIEYAGRKEYTFIYKNKQAMLKKQAERKSLYLEGARVFEKISHEGLTLETLDFLERNKTVLMPNVLDFMGKYEHRIELFKQSQEAHLTLGY